MKQISSDWKKCNDKESYKLLARESKMDYNTNKDHTKVYHKHHGIKKPENAFILFMQDKTRTMTEEQLENYQPPVPKPKKRQNKEKSKLNIELIVDPARQETTLLNVKTGEVYDGNDDAEERSQSDLRSTNPTTMTLSCIATECNESILGDKDGDNPSHIGDGNNPQNPFLVPLPKTNKPKINRKTLISQIAKEWKALPENERRQYRIKAKGLMQSYKKQKKDKLIELMQKAIVNRNEGKGVVKRHRSSYNYYIKEKLKKKWDVIKKSGEKMKTAEVFKTIADNWKHEEDMSHYNKLHEEDEERHENEILEFFSNGGVINPISHAQLNSNANYEREILLENNSSSRNFMNFSKNIYVAPDHELQNNDCQMDNEVIPEGFYDLLPLNPDENDYKEVDDELREEYRRNGIEYKDEESDIEV